MTMQEQVKAYVEDHRSEMLAMWKDFVETPSQARDRAAAMKMADTLTAVFEEMACAWPSTTWAR